MDEKIIKVINKDGNVENAKLTFLESENIDYTVVLTLNDGTQYTGTDCDWFYAFREMRKTTDKLAIKILVQASRPNCWPSGMSSQMSKGLKIYERDLEQPMNLWKSIEAFDEALESQIGTIVEQDIFNEKLRQLL